MDTGSHQNAPDPCSFCSLSEDVLEDVALEMRRYHENELSKRGNGGWRRLGRELGFSGAYVREVALGEKAVTAEVAERWLVLTFQIQHTYRVSACPDCGGVHTGRCHGKPVGQVVVRPLRQPALLWRDMPVSALRQAIQNRQPFTP